MSWQNYLLIISSLSPHYLLLVCVELLERRVAPSSIFGKIKGAPSFFLPSPLRQDLMVIRSKREKEREEEKKKSSFLLGDLVQIPSNLREGVHATIIFFKI